MGWRKDDCQNDCWWDWWEDLDTGMFDPRRKSWEEIRNTPPDPHNPRFQMCMNACDTTFGTKYERLMGVVDWKAVKRSLAEGAFTSFDHFTIGFGDAEYGREV